MEIKFKTTDILRSITMATSVVNRENTLPILGDLKFEVVSGATIKVIASDGEVWLQLKADLFDADCVGTSFCINAQDFLKAIKGLGEVVVTMSLDTDKHTITCNYGNGHFTMPFEDAAEYPMPQIVMDDAMERILDGKRMLKAIEKTGFAIANDKLRPIMNGIHFDFFKNKMVAASTDGLKLAKYCDTTVTHKEELVPNFTLSAKPSNILKNILSGIDGDIKIAFTDKACEVNNTSFKLTARLIEGRFPNYDSVIPKDIRVTVDVDKTSIMNALKRVLPMGNANSELVTLTFKDNTVTIIAEDYDFSKSASEVVKCDYNSTLPPTTIGFKGSTLLQLLTNIDGDNVAIELIDPSRAAVIYDGGGSKEEYLSLIMPMLIQANG